MKKHKSKKSPYWDGIPDELIKLCHPEIGETISAKDTISFLERHMNDSEKIDSGITHFDFLRMVDVVFDFGLNPVNTEDWRANTQQIARILTYSEKLLKKIDPADYKLGVVTPKDYETPSIISIAQRLEVWFAFLYYFTDHQTYFERRLKQVLVYTQRNVQMLIRYGEDAVEYAEMDNFTDQFHYVGTDIWQPIHILTKSVYMENVPAIKALTRTYDTYTRFLWDLQHDSREQNVNALLYVKAEGILRHLIDNVLYSFEEQEDDNQGIVTPDFLQENEVFESMLDTSIKREASAREFIAIKPGHVNGLERKPVKRSRQRLAKKELPFS